METVAYSTEQAVRVLRRAGEGNRPVSSQQLARWARGGLLPPSLMHGGGRGSSRAYAFADLVAARSLALLSDHGRVSQERGAKVMGALREAGGQRLDRLALHGDLAGERWRVAGDDQGIWHCAAVAVVSLGMVERELREACLLEQLPVPTQPPVAVPL